MTTQQHPITPPLWLVQQWFLGAKAMPVDQWVTDVATQAAHWGADQELEACCEWLVKEGWFRYEHEAVQELRVARRPKPPSLKDQALEILGYPKDFWSQEEVDTIRRALEQLDD